jgi:hypothetical protein
LVDNGNHLMLIKSFRNGSSGTIRNHITVHGIHIKRNINYN